MPEAISRCVELICKLRKLCHFNYTELYIRANKCWVREKTGWWGVALVPTGQPGVVVSWVPFGGTPIPQQESRGSVLYSVKF